MLDNKEHLYENAVLVGVITQQQEEDKLIEYMDELEFLAHTAGATVVKRFTQKLTQPDSKTFIGSGKAQEVREYVKENGHWLINKRQSNFTWTEKIELG